VNNQTEIWGVALEMKGVTKKFPGTLAVNNVDFEVRSGEVHALMGENGAGKSTLMKIIAGSFNDYTGSITINGKEVLLCSPGDAKKEGVGMIYQELSLAKPISLAENILVGKLPVKGLFINRKQIESIVRSVLERVGLSYLDPFIEVSEISQHEAQLAEIGKALYNNPCILVMDEPTSALSSEEVQRLFDIIRDLKNNGIAIVYISHHLSEVFEIADRVSVMRDGEIVGTHDISDITPPEVVELMVGRAITEFYKSRKSSVGNVVFEAKDISRWGFFHNVSFQLHQNEILGICGLAGAGRTELARAIMGIDKLDRGALIFEGVEFRNRSMYQAIRHGMGYLPENRKLQGLAIRMTMEENMYGAIIKKLSKGGVFLGRRGTAMLNKIASELQVYPMEMKRMISNFSGGNQQKILLGKWLASQPRLLILDEPTRGVDIGAKMLIHKTIERIAAQGRPIILISSDLPELVGLSDRVIVLREGKVLGEISGDEITEDNLLLAANGERRLN